MDDIVQEGMEITDEDLEGTDYEYPSSAGSGTASGGYGGVYYIPPVEEETTEATTEEELEAVWVID